MATLSENPGRSNSGGLGGFLHANPVISKLNAVHEQDDVNHCTYAGVGKKLAFFLAMVLAGIAVNAFLKLTGTALPGNPVFEDPETGLSITGAEVFILAVCGLIFLIVPFVSMFIRKTIPVTGSLYCIATGYLLSWLGGTFGGELSGPILLALLITVVLVLAMGLLYFTGKVQVNARFRTVMTTLFITAFLSGILTFILGLIPATRPFVITLANNAVISIGGGILMILIGCLFLMVDFDTIKRSVEGNLPKEYEWFAAYGLVFSVIWLYFKILELILRVTAKSRR